MSGHDNDHIDVPSIVPERDDDVARPRRSSARSKSGPANVEAGATRSGTNPLLIVLLLLLVGWGGWQQWQLLQAQQLQQTYQARVADLEQRLSVTDESMSESSVAMQVKLRELDSEIRKLWDNVWKRSKEQLAEHEQQLGSLQKNLKSAQTDLNKAEKLLAEQQSTLGNMRGQLDKASRLDAAVELNKRKLEEQQVALEAASDKVKKLLADVDKLERRVVANEEWVQSINAFRKQVNRELLSLKEQRGGTAP